MRYLPHTPDDIAAMLQVAGAGELDGSFFDHPFELPPGKKA